MHRSDLLGLVQQLLQAKQKAFGIQLGSPIRPSHPGGVVEAYAEQDPLRQLAP